MENINELKQLLKIKKSIALVGHRNPDGDAIGSCLALYHFFRNNGHDVSIHVPSEYPEVYEWMEGIDQFLIYDVHEEDANVQLMRAELIFCLDFNSLTRIDKMGEFIGNQDATLVMIDHHLYPDLQADFSLSDTKASSTCELVFKFILSLGAESEITPTIGDMIYTGLVTDTGSFSFGLNPDVFDIAGKLMAKGVDPIRLNNLIFNSQKEKHLRLLGHCLSQRMEILPEYKTGIICLTRGDFEHFNIQRGDTEGIVNYILRIKEIKMAVFITHQPTIIKLSFRSKGDFSVQQIASKYFKGGGHKNASGGHAYGSLKATVDKVKSILPEYKDELNA